MARGLAPRLSEGALVVLPRGYLARGLSGAQIAFASHPEPDRASVQAARAALRFFASFGKDDVIVCLISGGTSSLLALPRPGLTLEEKRRAVRRLVRSGGSILEVNRLRQRLSAVKGGKLGRSTRARLVNLVLSDVPGDDPAMVGSGPTVRDRSGDITRVVGSNALGLLAAAAEARRRGLRPEIRPRSLSGEARKEGALFVRGAGLPDSDRVLLAGGETTVTLAGRHGRGGRNLELALGAALELDGSRGIALLAAGSDGIDGSAQAAGAFADSTTVTRAKRLGRDPLAALARHDTEPFFEALGDLLVTGPTETNVGDWAFAIRL